LLWQGECHCGPTVRVTPAVRWTFKFAPHYICRPVSCRSVCVSVMVGRAVHIIRDTIEEFPTLYVPDMGCRCGRMSCAGIGCN
jgi:hypothetical protein